VVEKGNILYLTAPLFSAYRAHDYWAYRAIVQNALDGFLPSRMILPGGPGWVEFTLHTQPAGEGPPARRIVHVVCYHPRRTLQPIQHVDQSWETSGLSVRVLVNSDVPKRVYLAPEGETLRYQMQGKYIQVELPPVGTHRVMVIE
jgi:hypothetical protein